MASSKKNKRKKVVRQKSSKSSRKPFLYGLFSIIGLVILGYALYSVYSFQNSEQEKEGFVVCNKENTICEVSSHIHAVLKMNVCGKDIVFPKEKGNTNMQHTHKEENKLHWHSRVRIDPITKKPLNPNHTALIGFFDQMKYEFPESCSQNSSPRLTVEINGQMQDMLLNASWKDNDIIVVDYN